MLEVTTASSVSPLAAALAGVLGAPLDDPLAAEWVAVPSAAMGRWLALELARCLGASRVAGARAPRSEAAVLEGGEAGGVGAIDLADDGVVANVRFTYPGTLRHCLLDHGSLAGSVDRWKVEHLVWAVLAVLQGHQGDQRLGPLADLPDGATWFARARRLADMFDRYALWRPDMVLQWHSGRDVDGSDRHLPEHRRWQPYLWRCVRGAIGAPSPPERLPDLLRQLRAGALSLDLPARLAVFGVTAIPGGRHTLELLEALAVQREVHLLLLEPSPAAFARARQASRQIPAAGAQRCPAGDGARAAGGSLGGRPYARSPGAELRADPCGELVEHPLGRSWGRPVRERDALLRTHLSPTSIVHAPLDDAHPEPCTVLGRLQHDIRMDRAPAGDMEPDLEDRSVELHACHGPARQVDVLRDAIIHLLREDATLREEDILVLCPAITQFAPLIEAGFGPSAEGDARATVRVPDPLLGPDPRIPPGVVPDPSTPDAAAPDPSVPPTAAPDLPAPDLMLPDAVDGHRAARATVRHRAGRPRLRYRVTDRSLRETSPVLGAFDALLDLLAGRCTASDVLAFAALAPVRRRFAFDDETLATLEHWVHATNVRWGLDGGHRARWGLPVTLAASTWRSGIDQLLLGVAVSDGELQLAVGDVAPFGVEGDDIAVVGRFAELVGTIGRLVDQTASARPVAEWCTVLADAVDQLFAVDIGDRWQMEQLEEILRTIAEQAVVPEGALRALLGLADVRRMLGNWLRGAPARSDFFRGGVTICSLLPLRGLSYRVVCVLGLDEGALAATSSPPDGDDLVDADPHLGDPDPRGEVRLALLHGVLAARDRLVVTRTGRDPRTNAPVPPSTAYAELHGAVLATVDPRWRATYGARLETVHPCQPFDPRCFTPGALGRPGSWSFDPHELAGAEALLGRRRGLAHESSAPRGGRAIGPEAPPSTTVTLAELVAFLVHPVAFYLREQLGLFIARDDAEVDDDLFTQSPSLGRWALEDRLVRARLAGLEASHWARAERARGQLPPGGFGEREAGQIQARVDDLLAAAAAIGVDPGVEDRACYRVDAVLDDGTHVVGTLPAGCGSHPPGPATLTVSRSSPKQHLAAWLALVALTTTDPETQWRSVVVRRAGSGDGTDTLQLVVPGDTAGERRRRALDALAVAVDCYRRGRHEPLPIFPRLSFALHQERGIEAAWQPFGGQGDAEDPAIRLAFGDVGLGELLAIPAGPGDPPGDFSGRARRYASYLWGAVHTTAVQRS